MMVGVVRVDPIRFTGEWTRGVKTRTWVDQVRGVLTVSRGQLWNRNTVQSKVMEGPDYRDLREECTGPQDVRETEAEEVRTTKDGCEKTTKRLCGPYKVC